MMKQSGIKSRKQILTLIIINVCFSIYLEFLGNRILNPVFSFSEAWNMQFIHGAFRTFVGTTSMGILFILIGLTPRITRTQTKTHLLNIWSAGAGLFLLVMYLLILWAP